MGDLIFIATEKCLMPRLMKSACEKTPVACFYSKFHQKVVGWGGGWFPPPFSAHSLVLLCIDAAFISSKRCERL